jgi:hypothetical protein
MSVQLMPMRWPGAWKSAAGLEFLKGTPVNALVVEKAADLGALAERARQNGLAVVEAAAPPAGVRMVKGEWPGVQRPRRRDPDSASAGPTGNPWVDSNGWKIRLESALNPGQAVWVDVPPKERAYPASYVLAFADAAAHAGRWVISLEDSLAAALAENQPRALETWKRLSGAAAFFSKRPEWAECVPAAVIGIISDFTGENEFMGQELCNLVARTNQQYRIVVKGSLTASSLGGLRAVIYADAAPPDAALRSRVLEFVEAGGMLITGPNWGAAPGTPAKTEDHFRYQARSLGKGKVEFAKAGLDDPYVVANDAVVLMSHRYELLRFWNSGAMGSYFTFAPDRKRAIVHLLSYADRGPAATSVRVAGRYRTAKLWTLDRAEPVEIEMVRQKDAVELHLPQVNQYAAAELEVL